MIDTTKDAGGDREPTGLDKHRQILDGAIALLGWFEKTDCGRRRGHVNPGGTINLSTAFNYPTTHYKRLGVTLRRHLEREYAKSYLEVERSLAGDVCEVDAGTEGTKNKKEMLEEMVRRLQCETARRLQE